MSPGRARDRGRAPRPVTERGKGGRAEIGRSPPGPAPGASRTPGARARACPPPAPARPPRETPPLSCPPGGRPRPCPAPGYAPSSRVREGGVPGVARGRGILAPPCPPDPSFPGMERAVRIPSACSIFDTPGGPAWLSPSGAHRGPAGRHGRLPVPRAPAPGPGYEARSAGPGYDFDAMDRRRVRLRRGGRGAVRGHSGEGLGHLPLPPPGIGWRGPDSGPIRA